MAAAYPGGNGTFIPSFDATGQLVVSFSRNPKDFPLNQYITITPVKKSVGYYLNITAEQAARILNANGAEFIWPDGGDRPSGNWGDESFEFKPYATLRRNFPFQLGWKSVEQADWKIMASHAALVAQQAMTLRSNLVITALRTTGNHLAGHFDTATSFGGGDWGAGTVNNPTIKQGLMALAQRINLDSLGRIGPTDLVLVVNPTLATKMSTSEEMMDQFKQSQYAMAAVEGDAVRAGRWGLPPYVYGFKLVIEDTVKITSAKGAASKTIGYAMANDEAFLVGRPGGLTAPEGAASFSTVHLFSYEEMKVETLDDSNNRRTIGSVTDDFAIEVVAPVSGGLITGC